MGCAIRSGDIRNENNNINANSFLSWNNARQVLHARSCLPGRFKRNGAFSESRSGSDSLGCCAKHFIHVYGCFPMQTNISLLDPLLPPPDQLHKSITPPSSRRYNQHSYRLHDGSPPYSYSLEITTSPTTTNHCDHAFWRRDISYCRRWTKDLLYLRGDSAV